MRYFVYWYILFVISRCVFIVLNWSVTKDAGWPVLQSFGYGLRLDVSMICYVVVLPLLLQFMALFINRVSVLSKILKWYTIVLAVLLAFISIADAELYRNWGQKINAYAISFAKYPKEMLVFSSGVGFGKVILILTLFIALAVLLYKYLVQGYLYTRIEKHKAYHAVMWVGLLGLLVIGMRGGVGKTPLSQSASFYSSNSFLNYAALNTSWNLMASLVATSEDATHNPYVFENETIAKQTVTELGFKPLGHPYILNNPRPNIVLIILEGWSADVVGCVGGEANITPQLNALSKEGYLFDHFYAMGNRTDKGLAAIISAQPALPNSSIINDVQKFSSIPSISKSLKEQGYHTSFYYGGESEFANMKGYWLSAGYEKITDLNDFPSKEHDAEWGVHDGKLWDKTLEGLQSQSQPFFASILTLSSHEPYNVPEKSTFYTDAEADQYRNAVWYADKQLGAFFAKAKSQPWYANTIFIIQSDHGHKLPKYHHPMHGGLYHIPMLMIGGALKDQYKGAVNHKVSSQVNIAATLLGQLSVDASAFTWSHDCLDSAYKPYAAFIYHHGVGMINQDAKLVYSNFNKMVEWSEGDSSEFPLLEKQARSYLQVYYDEYLKR